MRRCPLLLAPIALALFSPLSAHASPLIETMGPLGGNAGAQGVVSGPGAASTYFNPALLAEASDELILGFAMIEEQLGVTLQGRPQSADVPLAVGGGGVLKPGGQPLPPDVVPTQWLQQGCPAGSGAGQCPGSGFAARPRQGQGSSGQTRTYLALGIVKSLVKDRFVLGIYGMLPLSSFTAAQAFYADEREALFSNSLHPELYGDRLTSVSVVFGAGLKLLPELSIGASASLNLANTATSNDYIQSGTDYSTLLLDNGVKTTVNVAPTLGVRWAPARSVRFGAAVHAPESFLVDTTITATLPTGTASGTTARNVFDWMPWSFNFGGEADLVHRGKYTMSVTASIDYALWSSYEDRQDITPGSYGPGLGFKNTLSGVVGVRHTYENARAFVDLRYIPSPVPEQIGRSNYVDNDRLGIVAGADVLLKWLKLRPGIQLFADRFIPRYNKKEDSLLVDELPDGSTFGATGQPVPGSQGLQTNNPGYPGFSSGGWLWGGAVTLSMPL